MKENNIQRELNLFEKELLFSLLPENKPGYARYRSLLGSGLILGEGRFGNGNFYMGNGAVLPDISIPSAPVFAIGTITSEPENYYAVIHELHDDLIEVQIDPYPVSEKLRIKKVVSFSNWEPGMLSPEDETEVKEYQIQKDKYILAVAVSSKKIWLHERSSGVNYLVPVSNLFNELLRLNRSRDEEKLKNPSAFFSDIKRYSAAEIRTAFLNYNRYLKKFDIAVSENASNLNKEKRKKLFNFFTRGNN